MPTMKAPLCKDQHGRDRVLLPTHGQLFMRNRASPFAATGSIYHGIDLLELLKEGHRDALFSTDGGGDVNGENFRVQFVFGELFLKRKLGTLAQVYHAPGRSFQHKIERAFCHLNCVDGVEISPCLPGETHPPNQQSDLTPQQVKVKEKQLFDQIFAFLNREWNSLDIKGYKINSDSVYDDEVHPLPPGARRTFISSSNIDLLPQIGGSEEA